MTEYVGGVEDWGFPHYAQTFWKDRNKNPVRPPLPPLKENSSGAQAKEKKCSELLKKFSPLNIKLELTRETLFSTYLNLD